MRNSVFSLVPIISLGLALSFSAASMAQAQDVQSFAPGSRAGQTLKEENHASSHENVAMLRLASATPDRFIGNMLTMDDGRKAGTILSVKRRKLDKELYLVIQAEPYFKDKITFAVPVLDVDRFSGDSVILTTLPGDFLRGIVYKAGEFQDVATYADWPLVVDE